MPVDPPTQRSRPRRPRVLKAEMTWEEQPLSPRCRASLKAKRRLGLAACCFPPSLISHSTPPVASVGPTLWSHFASHLVPASGPRADPFTLTCYEARGPTRSPAHCLEQLRPPACPWLLLPADAQPSLHLALAVNTYHQALRCADHFCAVWVQGIEPELGYAW